MADLWNRPGIGNVGSYQASGWPWITGSTVASGSEFVAAFPYVARRVQVQTVDAAGGGHIRVHFHPSGSNGQTTITNNHWWHVEDGQPFDATVRCTEVYISHDHGSSVEFRVMAELTNIPKSEMPALTGSGVTD